MSKKPTKFTFAARAVAACYTTEELKGMEQAIDTAADDSYEFSKQADEDDKRREEEMHYLDMVANLITAALEHKNKST